MLAWKLLSAIYGIAIYSEIIATSLDGNTKPTRKNVPKIKSDTNIKISGLPPIDKFVKTKSKNSEGNSVRGKEERNTKKSEYNSSTDADVSRKDWQNSKGSISSDFSDDSTNGFTQPKSALNNKGSISSYISHDSTDGFTQRKRASNGKGSISSDISDDSAKESSRQRSAINTKRSISSNVSDDSANESSRRRSPINTIGSISSNISDDSINEGALRRDMQNIKRSISRYISDSSTDDGSFHKSSLSDELDSALRQVSQSIGNSTSSDTSMKKYEAALNSKNSKSSSDSLPQKDASNKKISRSSPGSLVRQVVLKEAGKNIRDSQSSVDSFSEQDAHRRDEKNIKNSQSSFDSFSEDALMTAWKNINDSQSSFDSFSERDALKRAGKSNIKNSQSSFDSFSDKEELKKSSANKKYSNLQISAVENALRKKILSAKKSRSSSKLWVEEGSPIKNTKTSASSSDFSSDGGDSFRKNTKVTKNISSSFKRKNYPKKDAETARKTAAYYISDSSADERGYRENQRNMKEKQKSRNDSLDSTNTKGKYVKDYISTTSESDMDLSRSSSQRSTPEREVEYKLKLNNFRKSSSVAPSSVASSSPNGIAPSPILSSGYVSSPGTSVKSNSGGSRDSDACSTSEVKITKSDVNLNPQLSGKTAVSHWSKDANLLEYTSHAKENIVSTLHKMKVLESERSMKESKRKNPRSRIKPGEINTFFLALAYLIENNGLLSERNFPTIRDQEGPLRENLAKKYTKITPDDNKNLLATNLTEFTNAEHKNLWKMCNSIVKFLDPERPVKKTHYPITTLPVHGRTEGKHYIRAVKCLLPGYNIKRNHWMYLYLAPDRDAQNYYYYNVFVNSKDNPILKSYIRGSQPKKKTFATFHELRNLENGEWVLLDKDEDVK